MTDSTKRFSDRVEDYVKYRPHYPDSLVRTLEEVINLDTTKTIADIGSGTGISSMLFLKMGYTVIGVEPNKEMREAAEQSLAGFQRFSSVDGSAEKTNLSDNSVDLLFSGQAFHWFDKEKSKIEFNRILNPNGNIVLAWNERSTSSTFQRAYEQLLYDHIEGYQSFSEQKIDESLIYQFFSPKPMHSVSLENSQTLDNDGFIGRLRSSSYFPTSGAKHDTLLKVMQLLFEKYQRDHTITIEYVTKVYWC